MHNRAARSRIAVSLLSAILNSLLDVRSAKMQMPTTADQGANPTFNCTLIKTSQRTASLRIDGNMCAHFRLRSALRLLSSLLSDNLVACRRNLHSSSLLPFGGLFAYPENVATRENIAYSPGWIPLLVCAATAASSVFSQRLQLAKLSVV